MSFRQLLRRWQGVLLSLVGIVATVWMGATGQLGLYIHPRYFLFTIIMAAIGAVLALAAFAIVPAAREGHSHGGGGGGRWKFLGPAASTMIIITAMVGLLLVPPSTLTTATVRQRELNGSMPALTTTETSKLVGADYTAFTVRDWASLLHLGSGGEFVTGKKATITGFVTPAKSDPDNVFFIARFLVTCCAVDAQPIGIPVYYPGWRDKFKIDSWVTVSSVFGTNPSPTSDEAIVLIPDTITPVEQPGEPYVY
jgi:uncharacterized repeat protein (TIGR03943 family)